VMGAKSFAEIQDGITALKGKIAPDELGEIMQRAFIAAELAGRDEAD